MLFSLQLCSVFIGSMTLLLNPISDTIRRVLTLILGLMDRAGALLTVLYTWCASSNVAAFSVAMVTPPEAEGASE